MLLLATTFITHPTYLADNARAEKLHGKQVVQGRYRFMRDCICAIFFRLWNLSAPSWHSAIEAIERHSNFNPSCFEIHEMFYTRYFKTE